MVAVGSSIREHLYQKALDAAGVGVWEWDIVSNELVWSDEHFRLFGYEPNSFVPTYDCWESMIHPDDLGATRAAVRRAIDAKGHLVVDYRVVMPDASIRSFHSRGRVEHRHGQAVAMCGTVMDMTEHAANLSESEPVIDTYLLALDAGNLAVFDYDVRTGHLDWSDSHFRLFGYNERFKPEGRHWLDRIHPDDRPLVESAYAKHAGRVPELMLEYRILLPDGTLRWIENRTRSVNDAEGNPTRIFGVAIDVTDQKVAEQERRRTQEKMNLAMEAGQMALFEYDYQKDEVYWSDENFAMFGYPEAVAPTYEAWWDRVHPDDKSRMRQAHMDAQSLQLPLVVEYRLIWPDGSVHWLESRAMFEFQPDGNPRRIFGVTIDIDERKRRELALEESQSTLSLAMEASRLGIFWTDYERGVVSLSARACELLDFPHGAQPTLEELRSRYHPEDVSLITKVRQTHSPDNPTYHVQTRFGQADGTYRWLETRGRYRFNESGELVQLVAVVMDIDDQKRGEEAIRISEEQFRLMADQSPVMIYLVDENFQTTYLNPQWCEFTGHPPEACFGRKWERLVHPDDLPALLSPEAYSTQQPFRREYRLLRHDGEYRWCVSLAAPRVSREGDFLGRVGTIYDIHESKMAQEDLEGRVNARTEELIAANKEMEGFTYTVAHDLRTPLRAITSNSRILLEDYLDELPVDAQLMLHRQADAATRMGMLIDDLLQYTRIGRGELQRVACDLGSIADTALQDAVDGEAIEFEFAKSGDLSANCDPRLMQMVLANLFSNAVKFRSQERPLYLCLTAEETEGEKRFVVADNGIGFDQQYVDKIFLPFERLVRNDEYPGTGIGLANVARIVRRHGGRVWAEGTLGEGAQFGFTLG